MPTITYNKKELVNLVGRKISDEQLEEVINLVKPNVEKMEGNEITIEHTADRPDLFGVEGLARAIADYLGIKPGLEKYSVKDSGLTVKVDNVPVRPYIACAVLKNVKLTGELIKSLVNIQEVLHETFGRKREKVAIGVHDFDKIKPPIKYVGFSREAKMIPLEFSHEMTLREVLEKVSKGKEYGHIIEAAKFWPVFIDEYGIFSFPPIINSDRTKLTDKTKNLFLDITGTDKTAVMQTMNIIVTNFADRGAKIESVKLKYEKKSETTPNLNETVVEVDKNTVNKILGINIPGQEMIKLLNRMGYDAVDAKEKLEVVVPSYRTDILHPVDIIEDIAIAYGYNNFIPQLPNVSTVGSPHPLEKLCEKIRQSMIGFGFQEVVRPVLSNHTEQFDKMNVPREEIVELENPVSEEYTCMRSWLLPSEMKVLAANKHVEYPQNIFEIGDVVWIDDNEETRTKTVRKICGVICHNKAGFAEIKSIVDHLLKSLEIGYHLEKCEHSGYTKGRAAHVFLDKKLLGSFGEVNPKTLENWGIEMPVASFELNIENIL